ncbi:cation channel sperm-associated targeting subunit tau-like isoform X18 [Narcine bancroftii]|uniref:cation channel sperm-associated targeting subunit tau-like isoform X18 n=1 Tax=Narcine bancroftii TaxID=1343680 RepID=UPI0038322C93
MDALYLPPLRKTVPSTDATLLSTDGSSSKSGVSETRDVIQARTSVGKSRYAAQPTSGTISSTKETGILKRFMGFPKEEATVETPSPGFDYGSTLAAVDEPVGCLAFHVKYCKDFTNTFVLKKRLQLIIQIRVGCTVKCTMPHLIKHLQKVKKLKIFIPFEEVKYFIAQIPKRKSDERNKITVELLGIDQFSEGQRLLGQTCLHLIDIVEKGSVTETYELGIKNLPVCNLSMSIDFSYGYFGYGYSNQLKPVEKEKQSINDNSLFLRIPPLENRKDEVNNVITYQTMPYPSFLPEELQISVGSLGRERDKETVAVKSSEYFTMVPQRIQELMRTRKRLEVLRSEYNEKKAQDQCIDYLEQLILRKISKPRKILRTGRKSKVTAWVHPKEKRFRSLAMDHSAMTFIRGAFSTGMESEQASEESQEELQTSMNSVVTKSGTQFKFPLKDSLFPVTLSQAAKSDTLRVASQDQRSSSTIGSSDTLSQLQQWWNRILKRVMPVGLDNAAPVNIEMKSEMPKPEPSAAERNRLRFWQREDDNVRDSIMLASPAITIQEYKSDDKGAERTKPGQYGSTFSTRSTPSQIPLNSNMTAGGANATSKLKSTDDQRPVKFVDLKELNRSTSISDHSSNESQARNALSIGPNIEIDSAETSTSTTRETYRKYFQKRQDVLINSITLSTDIPAEVLKRNKLFFVDTHVPEFWMGLNTKSELTLDKQSSTLLSETYSEEAPSKNVSVNTLYKFPFGESDRDQRGSSDNSIYKLRAGSSPDLGLSGFSVSPTTNLENDLDAANEIPTTSTADQELFGRLQVIELMGSHPSKSSLPEQETIVKEDVSRLTSDHQELSKLRASEIKLDQANSQVKNDQGEELASNDNGLGQIPSVSYHVLNLTRSKSSFSSVIDQGTPAAQDDTAEIITLVRDNQDTTELPKPKATPDKVNGETSSWQKEEAVLNEESKQIHVLSTGYPIVDLTRSKPLLSPLLDHKASASRDGTAEIDTSTLDNQEDTKLPKPKVTSDEVNGKAGSQQGEDTGLPAEESELAQSPSHTRKVEDATSVKIPTIREEQNKYKRSSQPDHQGKRQKTWGTPDSSQGVEGEEHPGGHPSSSGNEVRFDLPAEIFAPLQDSGGVPEEAGSRRGVEGDKFPDIQSLNDAAPVPSVGDQAFPDSPHPGTQPDKVNLGHSNSQETTQGVPDPRKDVEGNDYAGEQSSSSKSEVRLDLLTDIYAPLLGNKTHPYRSEAQGVGILPHSNCNQAETLNQAQQEDNVFATMIVSAMKEVEMEQRHAGVQKHHPSTTERCKKEILFPEVVVADRKRGILAFRTHKYVLEQDRAVTVKQAKTRSGSTRAEPRVRPTCRYVRKAEDPLERQDCQETIQSVLPMANAENVDLPLTRTATSRQDVQQVDEGETIPKMGHCKRPPEN